jgi:hypothetical protein
MPDIMKKQREARRKIIRQWTMLPRDKRQSIEEISAFAKTAARQNENAFVGIVRLIAARQGLTR